MNQINNLTQKKNKKKKKNSALFHVALVVWLELPQPKC